MIYLAFGLDMFGMFAYIMPNNPGKLKITWPLTCSECSCSSEHAVDYSEEAYQRPQKP